MPEQIEIAVAILRGGGIGAFPTDTVYGLGASPFLEAAVERVFAAKQRPRHLPLPLLLADMAQVFQVVREVSPAAHRLMERFSPGALTLVLPPATSLRPLVTGGSGGVAVRIPDHPVPIALARGLGGPIIGTSANLSGAPSPVTAAEVAEQLADKVDFIINGGRCPLGTESTIIDLTGVPRLIREGAISRREIEEVLECELR